MQFTRASGLSPLTGAGAAASVPLPRGPPFLSLPERPSSHVVPDDPADLRLRAGGLAPPVLPRARRRERRVEAPAGPRLHQRGPRSRSPVQRGDRRPLGPGGRRRRPTRAVEERGRPPAVARRDVLARGGSPRARANRRPRRPGRRAAGPVRRRGGRAPARRALGAAPLAAGPVSPAAPTPSARRASPRWRCGCARSRTTSPSERGATAPSPAGCGERGRRAAGGCYAPAPCCRSRSSWASVATP